VRIILSSSVIEDINCEFNVLSSEQGLLVDIKSSKGFEINFDVEDTNMLSACLASAIEVAKAKLAEKGCRGCDEEKSK